jgi:protein-disulfide isomerase-like protein with CxxC motif
VSQITVTHFSDPGCPWAYSASPAMAVLRWRYREQLSWRLVTIGLTESPQRYIDAGYTPTRSTIGNMRFRSYGMPFGSEPRARIAATGRACRAIVATRLLYPGREDEVLRALQLGWFTTTLVLDEDADIARALARVDGLDVDAVIAAIDEQPTLAAYEDDKQQTRSAEGSATQLQGKARQTDGPVRYSAPSLAFHSSDGRRVEAGGFQPVEAYDILVANIDPKLHRESPPETPAPLLERWGDGLTTQEVAALMAGNNEAPDRAAAEAALLELVGTGEAVRHPLGDDAVWQSATAGEAMDFAARHAVAMS